MQIIPKRSALRIKKAAATPSAMLIRRTDVLLIMLDADATVSLANMPFGDVLTTERARLPRAPGSLWTAVLPTAHRTRVIVGELPRHTDTFQRLSVAGRMVRDLGTTQPGVITLASLTSPHAKGTPNTAPVAALLAALAAIVESQPTAKSKAPPPWQPTEVVVCGVIDTKTALAIESAAHLARWLTALPPNVLTPKAYQQALVKLAKLHGWKIEVFSEARLKQLKAGAFTAVARGSATRDAALVRLQYRPKGTRGLAPLALVGKGVCFDTGGNNLKSAKHMLDMHTDMAGSAVALGTLEALTRSRYPGPVDAWLALVENRIGPDAYTQQDIVTAANGTTIQVIHTDAEGRMILADTLALASRTKPCAIIDFATLTGACLYALTERLSGVFTNHNDLRAILEDAGNRSGERVWSFPMPTDFDEDLETPMADVVQCLIDGKGDHIYAAKFLSRFVAPGIPWAHIDLSSASRPTGLAHVSRPITGFGVRFAVALCSDPAFHKVIRSHAQTK